MTCNRCRKKFEKEETRCPHCGEPRRDKGTFQTSTVLISSGGSDLVYRSVGEVPPHLRTRLLKSTKGGNSATIVIADRRGRKEVARALRKTPAPQQVMAWLTPGRRRAIATAIVLGCLALIVYLFTHKW